MGSSLSRIQATIYDRDFPRFPRPAHDEAQLNDIQAIIWLIFAYPKLKIKKIAKTHPQQLHVLSDCLDCIK